MAKHVDAFDAPRPDLVAHALPFLPAGSEVRQVFIAQSAPSFFYFIITYLTGVMWRETRTGALL